MYANYIHLRQFTYKRIQFTFLIKTLKINYIQPESQTNAWRKAVPHNISIRVSEELYKGLQLKAEEMGKLKLSDALRILLTEAIEKPMEKKRKIKDKELQYVITTYYLVKGYITNLGEIGSSINNGAHEAAEQAIANLVK